MEEKKTEDLWILVRTDENGNTFLIEESMPMARLVPRLTELERRGHKQ